MFVICFFFFFQAEDGIRDADVTGVQTCALPICAVTNAGQLVSQLRLIEHFLDIAQTIRPVPEIPACDGSLLLRAGISRTIKETSAHRRAALTLPLLLPFTLGKLILLALTGAGILA